MNGKRIALVLRIVLGCKCKTMPHLHSGLHSTARNTNIHS